MEKLLNLIGCNNVPDRNIIATMFLNTRFYRSNKQRFCTTGIFQSINNRQEYAFISVLLILHFIYSGKIIILLVSI